MPNNAVNAFCFGRWVLKAHLLARSVRFYVNEFNRQLNTQVFFFFFFQSLLVEEEKAEKATGRAVTILSTLSGVNIHRICTSVMINISQAV